MDLALLTVAIALALGVSSWFVVRRRGGGSEAEDPKRPASHGGADGPRPSEQRLQMQLQRFNLLDHLTRAISQRQDLQSIFHVVLSSLEDDLSMDFACVGFYDRVQEVLIVARIGVKSAPLAARMDMFEKARIAIDENGLSRCIRGQLVHEPELSQHAFPFPRRLSTAGLQSLVAAPLAVEDNVFGVLISARRQPRGFSSPECEFLRHLGEHVALAVHQTELYTALQRAYDDLRQTQQVVMQQERLKALGQMASGIAHDINNAISPAALYTESLLETEPQLSERARDSLATIQRAIEDVARTVARMKEFYREPEPQLALTPVDVNELATHVVDLTRARWSDIPQQRGVVIDVTADLTPDDPTILGVESELREAVTNLVFNAIDAMPDGGRLVLRTRVSQTASDPQGSAVRRVHLEVVDTGVGMSADTRRRCLEPFFTTKGERGTGLGLAMVYGIVQRHGAELEIESAPDHGTTARLNFTAPRPADRAVTSRQSRPSRLKILLIDDDPLLNRSLQDVLENDGHVVTTANGGQAGIDAFHAARREGRDFGLVITDLGMPYVDGRQVARAIKETVADTPVILLTGWGQRLHDEASVPMHIDRVLSKPPRLPELRLALSELTPPPS